MKKLSLALMTVAVGLALPASADSDNSFPPPNVQPWPEFRAPPVTVTAPRQTEDQIINDDAVNALLNDGRLSGRIGVETKDRVVTINGRVATPGQARRAARIVGRVDGVLQVKNDLRTYVGAFY